MYYVRNILQLKSIVLLLAGESSIPASGQPSSVAALTVLPGNSRLLLASPDRAPEHRPQDATAPASQAPSAANEPATPGTKTSPLLTAAESPAAVRALAAKGYEQDTAVSSAWATQIDREDLAGHSQTASLAVATPVGRTAGGESLRKFPVCDGAVSSPYGNQSHQATINQGILTSNVWAVRV